MSRSSPPPPSSTPASKKRGRAATRVWEAFEVLPGGKTFHPAVRCKFCDFARKSAEPGKHLAPHIRDCPNLAPETKRELLREGFGHYLDNYGTVRDAVGGVENEAQHGDDANYSETGDLVASVVVAQAAALEKRVDRLEATVLRRLDALERQNATIEGTQTRILEMLEKLIYTPRYN